jgi:hypothetical protein
LLNERAIAPNATKRMRADASIEPVIRIAKDFAVDQTSF